jgi:hypothetical protein
MAALRLLIPCCVLAAPVATPAAEPLPAPVTIPIEIVAGFPVLIARIGDRELPLVFDLGAPAQITLTAEAMRAAGVVASHREYTWRDAKGNLLRAPRFSVEQLRLGGAVFHDVEGHVAKFADSYPAVPLGQAGYVGSAFVRPYLVLLDYAGGAMTLFPRGSTRAARQGCHGTVVPMAPGRQGPPVTQAKTDLGTLIFVWDTGASTTVVRPGLVAAPGATSVSGTPVRSGSFELGGVDFGPLDLTPFYFAEPAGADGFIGANFFAAHVVCIDFGAGRLFVRASR